MHVFVAALWFCGGLLRLCRQARFFQIEEYQNGRFWRWWLVNFRRRDWQRPLAAVMLALVIMLLVWDNEIAQAGAGLAAGLIAIWPVPDKEVKKPFVRTPRALRLLAASFLLFGAVTVLVAWLVNVISAADVKAAFGLALAAGLMLYWIAPLFLVGGNVLVAPVEAAMRRLYLAQARCTLRRLAPGVIGITGSYGKTSTKHFLAYILSGRYDVVATPKSYNTLMGVTLAINTQLVGLERLDYFIVEMGAYVEGEIAQICQLAQPDISLVTAVGPQHLERFGSMAAIASAKSEIVAALLPDGAAILNADDDLVRAMADRAPVDNTCVLVSAKGASGANLIARDVRETLDGLQFTVVETATGDERPFQAPVYGLHNVTNLLMAAAAARHIGLPLGEIALRVAGLVPFEHRLQRKVHPGGLTILDDAYSANPVGAASALRVLGLHQAGRRILITPGMVELGEVQDEENRKLGTLAVDYATDIVLVGIEQTRPIAEGVAATAFDPACLHIFDTHTESVAWLRDNAGPGDTVLFLNDLPDTYL